MSCGLLVAVAGWAGVGVGSRETNHRTSKRRTVSILLQKLPEVPASRQLVT